MELIELTTILYCIYLLFYNKIRLIKKRTRWKRKSYENMSTNILLPHKKKNKIWRASWYNIGVIIIFYVLIFWSIQFFFDCLERTTPYRFIITESPKNAINQLINLPQFKYTPLLHNIVPNIQKKITDYSSIISNLILS